MGTLNTARTRLGVGGPAINYTRPFLPKTPSIPAVVFKGAGIILKRVADVVIKLGAAVKIEVT